MPHFPFQRLQADLAALIAKTKSGDRLLSEPELAKQLGVSRATLREAMRTFETQGLIRRRQGSGTFVVGKAPILDNGLEILESLETMAKRLGLKISFRDLDLGQISADDEFPKALKAPVGTRLTHVRRVIRTYIRTVLYLVDVLPDDL